MKKIMSIFMLLCVCFILAGCNKINSSKLPEEMVEIVNPGTSEEYEVTLYRANKWVMKYDDDGNVISVESIYGEAEKPGFGTYYTYDENGNRLSLNVEDYAYQEWIENHSYEYEGEKLICEDINGRRYDYDYTESDKVIIKEDDNNNNKEILYFDEAGRVLSLQRMYKEELRSIDIRCEYNEDGLLVKLEYFPEDLSGMCDPYTYEYEYDDDGNCKEIKYVGIPFWGNNMTAKFTTDGDTGCRVAYTYDDESGSLIGKYYYLYEKDLLKEVVVYYTSSLFIEEHDSPMTWADDNPAENSYPLQEITSAEDYFKLWPWM